MKNIYLDYAAATPVSEKALNAMLPYFAEQFYNPSAPYLPAKHVRDAYETAKDELAHTIGAKGNDLIITAGATESINLAFSVFKNIHGHALILSTEHASVREAAKNLADSYAEIKVDQTGYINLADLKQKITPDTVLISVALANNELGTIQPLSEIAQLIKTERQNRLKNGNLTPLYLHSDASQALSLVDISVARLGVDLLTINSAKVYGPKGIGALYVAHGIKLSPIVFGGGQESGLRSGTENVPLLVGFATAAKEAKAHLSSARKNYEHLSQIFKQTLEAELNGTATKTLENSDAKNLTNDKSNFINSSVKYLGTDKHRLANFISVSFSGVDAERLIYKLEDQGIYISTGAACAASKGEKSHVLTAIGLSDAEIAGSLRITMGKDTTEDGIKTAASAIAKAVLEEKARVGAEMKGQDNG